MNWHIKKLGDDYEILETKFYSNRTLFIVDNGVIYVGMRSVVDGMGLSWFRQKQKIKEDRRAHMLFYLSNGQKYKGIFLHELFLPDYLNSINIKKIPDSKKEKVLNYKGEFQGFVCGQVTPEIKLNIYDSYMDNGTDGMFKLVRDSARMDYQGGHERMAEIFVRLLNDPNLNKDGLLLSDEIHEIADYLSKNQFKLKK